MHRLRDDAGLSQAALAERAGLSVRQIARLEKDPGSSTVRTMTRICRVLGEVLGREVTIDELVREGAER